MIAVLERAKTVRALDRPATAIGKKKKTDMEVKMSHDFIPGDLLF
jgi:hypothetical protein